MIPMDPRPFFIVFLAGLALSLVSPALRGDEGEDPSLLTVDRIYATDHFTPERFASRWLLEGGGYTTLEESAAPSGGRDIVRHDPETGGREVLVPAGDLVPPGETSPLRVEDYAWSRGLARLLVYTESRRVWRLNTRGDYWVLDRASRELRKLGGDAPPSSLMFATFSPSGDRVAYVRERDLWVEDVRDGRIVRLTTSGSEDIINGTFDWVYEEELGLRKGFRWSPDGRSIAYWQIDTTGVREFPLVNSIDSLYPRIRWIEYPKVGETNPASRAGVIAAGGGETTWLRVPGDPREHYIARMDWTPEGKIALQQLNRLQNTNRLFLADAESGDVRCVFTDEDDAWVEVVDELEWLEGGRSFTWVSERDGFRRAYVGSRSGKEDPRAVTPAGEDMIRLLHIDEDEGWLTYIASPEDPTRRYLWRARLDGGEAERLTPKEQEGSHRYDISPDGRFAIHRFSTFDTPPVIELVSLPGHRTVRVLAGNAELRERLGKLRREPAEFFRVDIGEGVLLDAWCLKPPDLDPEKKYPVLVYVYGEPAGQTVLDRWSGSRYLWHLMLARRGYVVMSFDNRGTPAPRGRDWRKAVYRKIGILAPADQAAALERVLEERPYLDRGRVGIWGWSGGGSMSLNAIFKYPRLYHAAISVAPVPNQRYYDTIYQERYMGLPADNVEGFIEGSPIHFAHQLEGKLLLIHGTGDDNCHYQGTEALADELIRHRKPFDLMTYPNRTHAIREGVNTTLHLRDLMARWLERNLPPGGRTEEELAREEGDGETEGPEAERGR